MTTLAPNDFVHLHVHSEFSLLDGLGRITELVDTVAPLGMDSMAITDHGALYGAVAFYQAARSKGIKPIIGVETYVGRRSMTEKEGKADAQPLARDTDVKVGPRHGLEHRAGESARRKIGSSGSVRAGSN